MTKLDNSMKKTKICISCIISYLMILSSICHASNIGICAYRIKMDVLSGKIAFCIGDLKESVYIRSGDLADVYILDTKDNSVHQIMKKKDVAFLSWRRINGNSELWVSIIEDTIWPWRRPLYQLIGIQKSNEKITTKVIKSPDIVFDFVWSPDGEILAGKPRRDFAPPLFDDSKNIHSVGISLNEGKNAFIYLESPLNTGRLFWKNERTFYTQDIHGKAVREFHVQHEQIIPGNVLEYEDMITLFGIFEGNLVYQRNGKLYIDDNMVYDSETDVKWVKVSSPYIFFVEDSSIVVVNVKEEKIYKRNVENTDIFSVGLEPHTGKAYWLSLPDAIYLWDFRQDEFEAIFRIMLNM